MNRATQVEIAGGAVLFAVISIYPKQILAGGLKMDIEGAEQQALAGARASIAKFHPRLAISAYHRPEDPARIPAIVRNAWSGYTMECGHCLSGELRVIPLVLYFR